MSPGDAPVECDRLLLPRMFGSPYPVFSILTTSSLPCRRCPLLCCQGITLVLEDRCFSSCFEVVRCSRGERIRRKKPCFSLLDIFLVNTHVYTYSSSGQLLYICYNCFVFSYLICSFHWKISTYLNHRVACSIAVDSASAACTMLKEFTNRATCRKIKFYSIWISLRNRKFRIIRENIIQLRSFPHL